MFKTFKSFNTFKLFNEPIRSDGLNDLNGLNYLNRLSSAFYALFVVKSLHAFSRQFGKSQILRRGQAMGHRDPFGAVEFTEKVFAVLIFSRWHQSRRERNRQRIYIERIGE